MSFIHQETHSEAWRPPLPSLNCSHFCLWRDLDLWFAAFQISFDINTFIQEPEFHYDIRINKKKESQGQLFIFKHPVMVFIIYGVF